MLSIKFFSPEALLTGFSGLLSLAYVGPSGAMSLWALVAVIGAMVLALVGIILWPVRALWRKLVGGKEETGREGASEEGEAQADAPRDGEG